MKARPKGHKIQNGGQYSRKKDTSHKCCALHFALIDRTTGKIWHFTNSPRIPIAGSNGQSKWNARIANSSQIRFVILLFGAHFFRRIINTVWLEREAIFGHKLFLHYFRGLNTGNQMMRGQRDPIARCWFNFIWTVSLDLYLRSLL